MMFIIIAYKSMYTANRVNKFIRYVRSLNKLGVIDYVPSTPSIFIITYESIHTYLLDISLFCVCTVQVPKITHNLSK